MYYGQAMKQRVLGLYDQGCKTKEIAERLCVSKSWCRRVKQFRHHPPRKVGGRAYKLKEEERAILAQWLKEKPDATLAELQARIKRELGIVISGGALWNTLRRMKFSFKKSRSMPASRTARMSSWPAMSSSPSN